MGDAKRVIASEKARLQACEIVAGELVGIVDDRPIVRFDGALNEGVIAASIVAASELYSPDGSACVGCGLLIALRGPTSVPVILGVVRDKLAPPPTSAAKAEKTVVIDGERLVFQGSREIVLKCGPSEILLRSDGKVVVKGHDVVSRATRRNRLKGATVGIN